MHVERLRQIVEPEQGEVHAVARWCDGATEIRLLHNVAVVTRARRSYKLLLVSAAGGCGFEMTLQINITANGRMSLPADIRKRLGLTGGGTIYLDETEDGVVLRTANQAVARAQALAKQYTGGNPDASVDAFLGRRREDSGE